MDARHRTRIVRVALGLTVTLATAACQKAEERTTFTVTDSAGVEIVTSTGALWSDGSGWRVDTTPNLSIGTFGGDPEYELFNVSGAVRFEDGTIGVVNTGSHEVRFYDAAGRYLRAIGREGEGPGEFRRPSRAFPLAGDSVAVWDSRLRRMSVFDGQGTFTRSFSLGGGGQSYSVGAVSGRTLLAMTSIRFGRDAPAGARRDSSLSVLFDLDGDSLSTLGRFPAVDRFIRATGTGMTVARALFGRSTYRAAYGESWFVATNDAYVIDELDSEGTLVRSIRRAVAPVEVTSAMIDREIEVHLSSMDEQFQKMLAPLYAEMPKPRVLPSYGGLEVDPGGNLWVRHYGTVANPVYARTVFDPSGRMLGDIEFPPGLSVYEIGEDYVLGRWRDDMDIEFVRLHSLVKP